MGPKQFFSASRVLIVAGKGGVGKTTVTAVLAHAAARSGLSVLVIDVDGKAGLAGLLGGDPAAVLGYEPEQFPVDQRYGGSISARSLTPERALREYLETHNLGRLTRRFATSGALDVVSTATPGIGDLLVLGKIKQLEQSGVADLVLVDGPAAGHAVTMLTSAAGLLDSVSGGPIAKQAIDVQALLTDPLRCRVLLVTVPEATPVNEVIETGFALEDRVGVALAPVVVNCVYPERDLDGPATGAVGAAAEFRRARLAAQRRQLDRLATDLPIGRMTLPFLFTAGLTHADALTLSRAALRQAVDR